MGSQACWESTLEGELLLKLAGNHLNGARVRKRWPNQFLCGKTLQCLKVDHPPINPPTMIGTHLQVGLDLLHKHLLDVDQAPLLQLLAVHLLHPSIKSIVQGIEPVLDHRRLQEDVFLLLRGCNGGPPQPHQGRYHHGEALIGDCSLSD